MLAACLLAAFLALVLPTTDGTRASAGALERAGSARRAQAAVQPFGTAFHALFSPPGKPIELKYFLVHPFLPGDRLIGNTRRTLGRGVFGPHRAIGDETIKVPVIHGSKYLTTHSQFAVAVVSPGRIGRFKIYGVTRTPLLAEVVLRQGCLAANAGVTSKNFFGSRRLPVVRC